MQNDLGPSPSPGVRLCAQALLRGPVAGKKLFEKGPRWGPHRFAQELRLSTALTQALPELQLSQDCACPCTVLVQTLTHRLGFLAGSQTLLIARVCWVVSDPVHLNSLFSSSCPGAVGLCSGCSPLVRKAFFRLI